MLLEGWNIYVDVCGAILYFLQIAIYFYFCLGRKLQNCSAVKPQKWNFSSWRRCWWLRFNILGWTEVPTASTRFLSIACLLIRADVFVRSNIVYERLRVIYVSFPHWVTRPQLLAPIQPQWDCYQCPTRRQRYRLRPTFISGTRRYTARKEKERVTDVVRVSFDLNQ